MCEQCQQSSVAIRWLAMLLRRVGLLVVSEVERQYELPSSVKTKREREREQRRED